MKGPVTLVEVETLSVVAVEEGSGTLVGVETLLVVTVEEGPVTLVGVATLFVITVEESPVTLGVETLSMVALEEGPVTLVGVEDTPGSSLWSSSWPRKHLVRHLTSVMILLQSQDKLYSPQETFFFFLAQLTSF